MIATSESGRDWGSTQKPWFWEVISTFSANGETEDLMSEADAEDRHLADEFANFGGLVFQRLGIAGTVGEEDTRRFERENVFGSGIGRDHGDARTDFDEMAEDVAFDAVIIGDDVEALFGGGGAFIGGRDRVDAVSPFIGLRGTDAGDEVLAGHGR